jgi:exodeoxyribonuclease VII small subunit
MSAAENGKTKTEQAAKDQQALPFEEALARLEKIVEDMESGKLSLDQMMTHFEEGAALVKVCGGKLDAVEKKIELLIKQGDTVTTEPFEPES